MAKANLSAAVAAIAKKNSRKKELVVVRANRVKPKRKVWVWKPVLAAGAATLLTGMPKIGKSQIAEDIAARVSSGTAFPDEDPRDTHDAGTVFILTTEDGAADTMVPRLMAMGADMRNIRFVQSAKIGDERVGFDLATDLGLLEQAISECGKDGSTDSDPPKLVIISPITAYLGGKADSNNVSQVRAVLDPIGEMLTRLNLAALFIGHPKKGFSDEMALYHTLGSVGFVAAARIIFYGMYDPEDETRERRLFLLNATNLTSDKEAFGISFSIVPTKIDVPGVGTIDDISKVEWGARDDRHPDDVLELAKELRKEADKDARESKAAGATELIETMLNDGPRPAATIIAAAKEKGIGESTLNKAKRDLKVESVRPPGVNRVDWVMPASSPGRVLGGADELPR